MKVTLKSLGILKDAEFELGDLTLICGGNNMGKTYATYALFGFLRRWERLMKIDVPDVTVEDLFNDGVTRIDVRPYIKDMDSILIRCCREYSKQLSKIFASKPDRFKNSQFQVAHESVSISSITRRAFERKIQSSEDEILNLSKSKGETDLVISLLMDKGTRTLPDHMIKNIISRGLAELLFGTLFPHPFISSAERTGAAIFRKELNFARNRLLKEMIQSNENIDPVKLLFKSYQDYPIPVEDNVDFIRQLENVAKEDSFLARNHPDVLGDFADIIDGEYIAGSNDTIYFKPVRKRLRLTMDESSSAVRSLLDIGFYLRHVAEPGDLLMVDEPELNLHPENQRRLARIFARLVNLGIRVFMTTHSDYIVKELNTLILLNRDKPHLKRIAHREGYHTDELLPPNKIRVYIAEKKMMKLKENGRQSQQQTLVQASIDADQGIEARSFDETINKMNEIQEAIIWGGDE